MVRTVDVLLVVERLYGDGVLAVRLAHQDARQRQRDVARILRRAERLPLRVLGRVEHLAHVARRVDLRVALEVEHVGRRRGEKRRVRGGGNVRDLLEQLDVLTGLAELVVAEQRPERSAAEDAVLLLVHLLEQRALIEFGRALQVTQQILLRDVEHLDLERRARLRVVEEIAQSAPRRLELLELGRVHHLVQLQRDQMVDLCDTRVDHRFRIARHRHRTGQHLGHEVLDHVLAAFLRRGVASTDATVFDDLVEQRHFGGRLERRRRRGRLRIGHDAPPCPPISSFRRFILASSPNVACRISSSLSLPCSVPRRSASFVRRSSSSLSGFT